MAFCSGETPPEGQETGRPVEVGGRCQEEASRQTPCRRQEADSAGEGEGGQEALRRQGTRAKQDRSAGGSGAEAGRRPGAETGSGGQASGRPQTGAPCQAGTAY